jgi:hypothetical protein
MTEERKRKIAIVTSLFHDFNLDYDYQVLIANSITDWTEVTEKEYQDLYQGISLVNSKCMKRHKDPWFILLERQIDENLFIIRTIEDVKKHLKKVHEKNKEEIDGREKKRLEREKRKQEAARKQKQKIYEELKKEFESGGQNVSS